MSIQRYERPTSLASACALLEDYPGQALVLAGGTDLIGDIRAGRQVDYVVDIKRIPELQAIEWTADGTLVIGSCVAMGRVAEDERIRKRYTALTLAAGGVATTQIRNRATIAGNLGNASPCADTAPPLLVLGAAMRIHSPAGVRDEPFHGFIRDCRKTALRKGDILSAIVIPPAPPGLRSAFYKIKRGFGHDMAVVSVAGAFDPASREWRLAVGSAGPTPLMIPGLEGVCPPGATPAAVGDRLAAIAVETIRPIDDVRASAEYRRDMTAMLCRRLAEQLISGIPAQD